MLDVRVSRVDDAEHAGHDLLLAVSVDLEVVDHSHSFAVLSFRKINEHFSFFFNLKKKKSK